MTPLNTNPNEGEDMSEYTLDDWAVAIANERLPIALSLAVSGGLAQFRHNFGFYPPTSHLNTKIAAAAQFMIMNGWTIVDGESLEEIRDRYIEKEEKI